MYILSSIAFMSIIILYVTTSLGLPYALCSCFLGICLFRCLLMYIKYRAYSVHNVYVYLEYACMSLVIPLCMYTINEHICVSVVFCFFMYSMLIFFIVNSFFYLDFWLYELKQLYVYRQVYIIQLSVHIYYFFSSLGYIFVRDLCVVDIDSNVSSIMVYSYIMVHLRFFIIIYEIYTLHNPLVNLFPMVDFIFSNLRRLEFFYIYRKVLCSLFFIFVLRFFLFDWFFGISPEYWYILLSIFIIFIDSLLLTYTYLCVYIVAVYLLVFILSISTCLFYLCYCLILYMYIVMLLYNFLINIDKVELSHIKLSMVIPDGSYIYYAKVLNSLDSVEYYIRRDYSFLYLSYARVTYLDRVETSSIDMYRFLVQGSLGFRCSSVENANDLFELRFLVGLEQYIVGYLRECVLIEYNVELLLKYIYPCRNAPVARLIFYFLHRVFSVPGNVYCFNYSYKPFLSNVFRRLLNSHLDVSLLRKVNRVLNLHDVVFKGSSRVQLNFLTSYFFSTTKVLPSNISIFTICKSFIQSRYSVYPMPTPFCGYPGCYIDLFDRLSLSSSGKGSDCLEYGHISMTWLYSTICYYRSAILSVFENNLAQAKLFLDRGYKHVVVYRERLVEGSGISIKYPEEEFLCAFEDIRVQFIYNLVSGIETSVLFDLVFDKVCIDLLTSYDMSVVDIEKFLFEFFPSSEVTCARVIDTLIFIDNHKCLFK